MVQLAITVGIIALFLYVPEIKAYSMEHQEIWWISFGITIVVMILLLCTNDIRRRWPLNIILLGVFTVSEGIMLGAVATYYEVRMNFITSLLNQKRLYILISLTDGWSTYCHRYLCGRLFGSGYIRHANQMGFHGLCRNPLRLSHYPLHFRNCCHLHP